MSATEAFVVDKSGGIWVLPAGSGAMRPTGGATAASMLPFASSDTLTVINNAVEYPAAGYAVTLVTLTGAGVMRSLQMTHANETMPESGRLQFFTDGESTPSFDVEYGTLFGVQADAFTTSEGSMLFTDHTSVSLSTGSVAGTSSASLLFPVPYTSGLIVKWYNPAAAPSGVMFIAVQYQPGAITGLTDRYRLRSASIPYSAPVFGPAADVIPLFDVTNVAGHLVYFAMCAGTATNYTYLERPFDVYVNGEASPSYQGNSEDWWGSGYYFGGMTHFTTPNALVTTANNANFSTYAGIDLLALCGGIAFTSEIAMAYGLSTETKSGGNRTSTAASIGVAALLYADTYVPFVPAAPTVSVTPGGSVLTVGWTPNSPGSQPVTGYVVTLSPGGAQQAVGASATSATFTGLSVSTTYAASVVAVNPIGSGPAGTASAEPLPYFVFDSFTDPTGTLLSAHTGELGATWTDHLGEGAPPSPVITTDQCRRGDGTGITTLTCYPSGRPSGADYTVQCDLSLVGAPSPSHYCGIWARLDTTTLSGYLLQNSINNYTLFKCVSGTFTPLGSYGGAPSAGVKLTVSGTTISAFINGATRISVTDSTYSGPGVPALRVGASIGSDLTQGIWLDNFSALNLP